MSDLIRREDVFKTLGITDKSTKYGGDHSGYNTLMLYEIKGEIDSIPTAEPKVGRWIPYKAYFGKSKDSWTAELKCSECGYKWGDDYYNFCPNCGAKMERRADGED